MQAWEKLKAAQLELLRGQTNRRMRGTALQNVAQLLRAYPTDPLVLRTCANTCQAFSLQQEAARLRFQLCQLHDRRDELDARDNVLTELLRDDPRHIGGLRLAISVLKDGGRTEEAAALSVQLKEVLRGERAASPRPADQSPLSEQASDQRANERTSSSLSGERPDSSTLQGNRPASSRPYERTSSPLPDERTSSPRPNQRSVSSRPTLERTPSPVPMDRASKPRPNERGISSRPTLERTPSPVPMDRA
ncbi:MAG: hypothetical protein AAFN74_05120, partial [Myxococcota bacterium]